VVSGAKKLSLYEEVLRQVRYVNSEPQELNSRTFVLSCTELNGRFVSNKLETTVRYQRRLISVSHRLRLVVSPIFVGGVPGLGIERLLDILSNLRWDSEAIHLDKIQYIALVV